MSHTPLRKLDHIRIVLDSDVEHTWKTTLFEHVELRHAALPETNLGNVDTSIRFLGKRLEAPIMITGMTGGHEVAAEINCAIAKAAQELGLAMGVGSQRAAIERPELASTFSIARKCGPEIPLVANIGAPQLVKGYSVAEVRKAIEMIDADAVAIHLNAGQEAFQPEGDTEYRGVLEKIANIVAELDRPVIVKETGQGLSYEVALALRSRGVRFFDISGAGGTSWIKVEMYRAKARGMDKLARGARVFSDWGIPTLQALMEVRWASPDSCIIASGGIRTGLDVAKAIALGADIAGVALPVIRAYGERLEKGVKDFLEQLVFELRVALFLTGSSTLAELRKTELDIDPILRQRLEARGIDTELYLRGTRLLVEPGRSCSS